MFWAFFPFAKTTRGINGVSSVRTMDSLALSLCSEAKRVEPGCPEKIVSFL